jgi:hypothetical protein
MQEQLQRRMEEKLLRQGGAGNGTQGAGRVKGQGVGRVKGPLTTPAAPKQQQPSQQQEPSQQEPSQQQQQQQQQQPGEGADMGVDMGVDVRKMLQQAQAVLAQVGDRLLFTSHRSP